MIERVEYDRTRLKHLPFDAGRGFAAETAEQLASVASLHDARPQLEGECWRRLGGFLPECVGESLATTRGFREMLALDLRYSWKDRQDLLLKYFIYQLLMIILFLRSNTVATTYIPMQGHCNKFRLSRLPT